MMSPPPSFFLVSDWMMILSPPVFEVSDEIFLVLDEEDEDEDEFDDEVVVTWRQTRMIGAFNSRISSNLVFSAMEASLRSSSPLTSSVDPIFKLSINFHSEFK